MLTANVHQAKTQLSKLIDAALKGEQVIIARDGVPAVKLVPVAEKASLRREPGRWAGKARILDPDWDKPDPEVERLFYGSVLFPEDERRPAPDPSEPKTGGHDDDAASR